MPKENIRVEITDAETLHCFKLILNPTTMDGEETKEHDRLEIMLHASSLIELIHKCNLALTEWQKQTSRLLLNRLGVVAPSEFLEREKREKERGL